MMPDGLREALAADYAPVRRLPSPLWRAMAVAPFALLTLVAASTVFELRMDAARLGWAGTWGVSGLQALAGLALVVAALREAIPGRAWGRAATAAWLLLPICGMVGVTLASWMLSPIRLSVHWLWIGGLCFAGSTASSLPIVALAGVLAARAYPTRPLVAGALLGLGAGLVADAGWRLFCHYSEPAHVFAAHFGAVLVATALGASTAHVMSARRKT